RAQGTKTCWGARARRGRAVAPPGKHLSCPLTLDISFVANPDGSGAQTTTSDQKFESQEARTGKGVPFLGTVSNRVASADTLLFDASGAVTGFQDRKSSADYF